MHVLILYEDYLDVHSIHICRSSFEYFKAVESRYVV